MYLRVYTWILGLDRPSAGRELILGSKIVTNEMISYVIRSYERECKLALNKNN